MRAISEGWTSPDDVVYLTGRLFPTWKIQQPGSCEQKTGTSSLLKAMRDYQIQEQIKKLAILTFSIVQLTKTLEDRLMATSTTKSEIRVVNGDDIIPTVPIAMELNAIRSQLEVAKRRLCSILENLE